MECYGLHRWCGTRADYKERVAPLSSTTIIIMKLWWWSSYSRCVATLFKLQAVGCCKQAIVGEIMPLLTYYYNYNYNCSSWIWFCAILATTSEKGENHGGGRPVWRAAMLLLNNQQQQIIMMLLLWLYFHFISPSKYLTFFHQNNKCYGSDPAWVEENGLAIFYISKVAKSWKETSQKKGDSEQPKNDSLTLFSLYFSIII